ncbi:MAG: adenylate/guanylate cyclase domain-containing protein [Candidatus Kapaibacterium sp.]|nr:tetratricopeptide repeat protein [Bacteroidota bacterium]
MTHAELQALLDKANKASNTSNFDEAEQLAQRVLRNVQFTQTIPLSNVFPHSGTTTNSAQHSIPTVEDRKGVLLYIYALLSLATTAYRRGNNNTALEQAEQVLAVAEEYGTDDIKPKALNLIGNVYNKFGDYAKTLEYYNKALSIHQALGDDSGVARVTGNIGLVYMNLDDYSMALECMSKALSVHEALGDISFAASVTGNIGIVYYNLGDYDKAIEYFNKALSAHKAVGAQSSLARVRANIGSIYKELGDYNKALEYMLQALAEQEALGEQSGMAGVTGNIGNVYSDIGDYDKALEYYGKALSAHEALGEQSGIAHVTGNIGNVYKQLGDYNKALEYMFKALSVHEALGEESGVALVAGNIGGLYAIPEFDSYSTTKAEEYLLKAIALGIKIEAKAIVVDFYNYLADLYESQGRWKELAVQLRKYIEAARELNMVEVKKQEAIREHQRIIELAKATADAKMNATTTLLHRVLPVSIANRIINDEQQIADYFPNVSILFADIKGFTTISSAMPAQVVLQFLGYVFSDFDRIIKKHGCEKIKTIGDGYMAIAGAPVECSDHAQRITSAAFEMIESLSIPDELKNYFDGYGHLSIRVGIHCGPVVAGVVGEDRFIYDVFSDAVNTASRMESHGEAGRIHVSEEFVRALTPTQTHDSVSFPTGEGGDGVVVIPRGEIEIKGKGMMRTYFLERSDGNG